VAQGMKLASIGHLPSSHYISFKCLQKRWEFRGVMPCSWVLPDVWKTCTASPAIREELLELTDPDGEGTMILWNTRNHSPSNTV